MARRKLFDIVFGIVVMGTVGTLIGHDHGWWVCCLCHR